MRWSWRLTEVAGIGIFVHATFLMLVAWIGASQFIAEGSAAAALEGVAFVLALFGCVVLHELGHALTARRFGVVTRDITLYPIGGVARLERIPEEPRQELIVALVGPTVNLVIAAALWATLAAAGRLVPLAELDMIRGPFLERLLLVNLFLAGFNLIPAFPMDGGRALRALLATRLTYVRATEIAASVGQAVALGFGLIGLFTNPFLVFIALFVWLGASSEAGLAQMRAAFSGLPVSRAMLTEFSSVSPLDPLSRAVELTIAGSQSDFPVIQEGRPIGVLRQADLLKGLSERGPEASVAEFMRLTAEVADPHEMLDDVFARVSQQETRTLPVVRGGRVVGLLTLENLGEFLRIQAAMAARARARRPAPDLS
jgi:Zn-dependent protease/predicted transcriptional regulator